MGARLAASVASLMALTLALVRPPLAGAAAPEADLTDEDRLDLHCLRLAYPDALGEVFRDDRGNLLLPVNGRPVLFRRTPGEHRAVPGQEWDISESMAQIYPPEPARPPSPAGVAPGRRRSYAFLEALYGGSPREVCSKLSTVDFLGQKTRLNQAAARGVQNAAAMLRERHDLRGRGWLKVDGSYVWRKIAGENALSAHSYGIAIDLGARVAPYWRWSRLNPHPLQGAYPSEIVEAFERNGFIWGGKWHEYDLMHFEYRPELLCKGRIRAASH